jgi:peptidoglycan/LPS O-acetylase OafA/YrhL
VAEQPDPATPPPPVPSDQAGRHNNFTLLRLLAAFQVIYGHAVRFLDLRIDGPAVALKGLLYAYPGVPIFFVTSGFLISASWERRPDARTYARNRALRILPGLWEATAAALILLALFGRLASFVKAVSFVPWLIGELTVVQFFNPGVLRSFGTGTINGALWTIPVEMGFYILLPLIYIFVFDRMRPRMVAVTLGIAIGVSYAVWYYITVVHNFETSTALKIVNQSVVPHIHLFIIGILLQRNFQRIRPWVAGKLGWWTAGFLFSQFANQVLLHNALSRNFVFLLLTRLVLAVWVMSFAFTAPRLSGRLLGGHDISYGVYVFHFLVVNAAVQLGYLHDAWAVPAIMLIAAALGTMSWLFVESPALRLKRSTGPVTPQRDPPPEQPNFISPT